MIRIVIDIGLSQRISKYYWVNYWIWDMIFLLNNEDDFIYQMRYFCELKVVVYDLFLK